MRTRKIYSSPPVFYIDDREVSEAEYEAASPNRFNDMIASGQTPCCITDAALWQNHSNGSQFSGSRMAEAQGNYYASIARANGVDPKGKIYLSGLAERPGDPRAWVESRADIKRVCEERNWTCRGLVEHKRHDDYAPTPSVDLADHIVDELVAEQLQDKPGLVTNQREMADLREKVKDRHKPKYTKTKPLKETLGDALRDVVPT